MKLLCVASALDIGLNYGCTPAWWQFFKGLHELGHEVIATPYAGPSVGSPWWRGYPNPCQLESSAVAALKRTTGRAATPTSRGATGTIGRLLIETWVRPRWERHLERILTDERGVDALIVFNVPLNHFTGIPGRLRRRHKTPVFYFDGDVPASLPKFGGFASGFRGYVGADLSEYDGFMCNSVAGAEELAAMGARRVATVHWGVDPDLYVPLECDTVYDVLFYGYGVEYREEWFEAMVVKPCQELESCVIAIAGKGFPPTPIELRYIGNVPFNALRQTCAAARINLNISRAAHASAFGSSTLRLFELAAMGCCIVSNPHDGIETWFAPGFELEVLDSPDAAAGCYQSLLADPERRKSLGEAARRRVLREHTHRHRAADIVDFITG